MIRRNFLKSIVAIVAGCLGFKAATAKAEEKKVVGAKCTLHFQDRPSETHYFFVGAENSANQAADKLTDACLHKQTCIRGKISNLHDYAVDWASTARGEVITVTVDANSEFEAWNIVK